MAEIVMRKALNDALSQEMQRDPNVILLGEDIALYGGAFWVTKGLLEKFGPERVRDCPISENGIIGAAVGAAMGGLKPVAEIMFMDFITLAMDPLVNAAAHLRYAYNIPKVPMVVRAAVGRGWRSGADHSQSLEAWFCHIPGLKVVMPSGPYDAKGLLISSIRDESPIIFVEHTQLYRLKGEVPDEPYTIPLGKASVKRPGKDVTVVATGAMVQESLKAAKALEAKGIDVEVIDPMTLLPLDIDTIIESVKKTHKLVVTHEAVEFCGYGAEIVAQVADKAFDYLDMPIKRVAAPFTPIPFSAPLEDAYTPNAEKIGAVIQQVCG